MKSKKVLSPDELRDLDIARSIGGLNKSHRVQRVSSAIEKVYSLNSAILATEAREQRGADQRESRRAKR